MFVSLSCGAGAQVDTRFIQFSNNAIFFNPSLTGFGKSYRLTAIHHKQWVGPGYSLNTQLVSADLPINHNSMGLGVRFRNSNVLGYSETGLTMMYSYKMRLGKAFLGAGAGFGMQRSYFDNSSFTARESDDDIYMQSDLFVVPVIEAGVNLSSQNYLVSMSFKQIVYGGGQSRADENIVGNNVLKQFFALGKYRLELSEPLGLVPVLFVKWHAPFDPLIQFGSDVQLNRTYSFGARYSLDNELAFLASVNLNKAIKKLHQMTRVGYAYQIGFAGYAQTSNGSHEITLMVDFKPRPEASKILKRKMIISPQLLY